MPGRNWSSKDYRYGFNGKEMDDEMRGGNGATYDYGFRIYDSRIAKFLSVDPLTKDYPWYTPYQFAGNKPIAFIDLDGLEEYWTADGNLLGKVGDNSDIRLINAKSQETKDYIKKTITLINRYPETSQFKKRKQALFDGSRKTYSNTDDAAYEWSQEYNSKSMGTRYDKTIGREYSVGIYKFKLGDKIVFILGDSKTIDGDGSVSAPPPGIQFWSRDINIAAGAHTHGYGGGDIFSSTQYFKYMGLEAMIFQFAETQEVFTIWLILMDIF